MTLALRRESASELAPHAWIGGSCCSTCELVAATPTEDRPDLSRTRASAERGPDAPQCVAVAVTTAAPGAAKPTSRSSANQTIHRGNGETPDNRRKNENGPPKRAVLLCLNQSAPGGIRTPNLLIRSQMLYPLSYGRSPFRGPEAHATSYDYTCREPPSPNPRGAPFEGSTRCRETIPDAVPRRAPGHLAAAAPLRAPGCLSSPNRPLLRR